MKVNVDKIRDDLKKFRFNKSKEENMEAYIMFNNETLEDIISLIPKNVNELYNVKGLGPV